MVNGRIIAAGLVGGIILFCWGAAWHMVLAPDSMGPRNLPAEETLLPAMKTAITEGGFYFFPGMSEADQQTEEGMQAWVERHAQDPWGILFYHPSGVKGMSTTQLGTELASNILAALLLAMLLARVSAPWGTRVLFSMLMGVFAWVSIDASYWNWYGFPTMTVVGGLIEQGVGWLVGGAVIAAIAGTLRKGAAESGPEAA